jgi:serine/threonine-protein kinase
MTSSPTASVAIGELVVNKYRVERVLGRGGMGIVVAALHEQLGQRVALKMLLPSITVNPDMVARFAREARAAVKIRGEHVARVLDVGELPSGEPFIVMEYLDGKDLADTLHESGPLALDVAIDYVLQACEALAEAHAAGIVHRDIKPSNVFVTRRPDGSPLVKVLDFGISKALVADDGDPKGLTTTSSFMGSPVYAPPEQLAASRDVDARADIWAIGTILYEALTGRTPFKGESVMRIASEIFTAAPPLVSALRPDLPPALGAVILRCLEKRPDDRFQNVRDLAAALIPFAPGSAAAAERVARIFGGSLPPPEISPLADTVRATPSIPRPAAAVLPAAASTSTSASFVGAKSGSSASRGVSLYVLAFVVGVVVAMGAAFTLGHGREERPATLATPPETSVASAAATPPIVAAPPIATPPPVASASASTSASPSARPAARARSSPPPTAAPRKSPLSVGVK